jgi:hypothetical protein
MQKVYWQKLILLIKRISTLTISIVRLSTYAILTSEIIDYSELFKWKAVSDKYYRIVPFTGWN